MRKTEKQMIFKETLGLQNVKNKLAVCAKNLDKSHLPRTVLYIYNIYNLIHIYIYIYTHIYIYLLFYGD